MRYSIEPKFIKYVKDYGFCHLLKNLVINMVKNKCILQLKLEQKLQKLLQKE